MGFLPTIDLDPRGTAARRVTSSTPATGAARDARAVDVRARTIEAALDRIAAVQGVRVPGPRPAHWEEDRTVEGGTLLHVAKMPPVFREDRFCSWRAYIYEAACDRDTAELLLFRADLYRDAQAALAVLLRRNPRPIDNFMDGEGPSLSRIQWAQQVCNWCAIAEWATNCRGGCLFPERWPYNRHELAAPDSARWRIWPDESVSGAAPTAAVASWRRAHEVATSAEGGPASILAWRTAPWHWDWHNERPRTLGPDAMTRGADGNMYGLLGFAPTLEDAVRKLHGNVTRPFRPGDDAVALYGPSDGLLLRMLRGVAEQTVTVPFEARITAAYLAWFDYIQAFDLSLLGLTPLQINDMMAALATARAEAEIAIATGGFGAVLAVGGVIAAATSTTGPFGIVAAIVIVVVALLAELLLALVGRASGSLCPPYPGPLHVRTVADLRCFQVHADDRMLAETVDASMTTTTVGGYSVPTVPPALAQALADARAKRDALNGAMDADAAKRRELVVDAILAGVAVLVIAKVAAV